MTVKFNAVYILFYFKVLLHFKMYIQMYLYMIILYQGNENYAQPKKAESTFL